MDKLWDAIRCPTQDGRSIRDVLQRVENALVYAGYDNFVLTTEVGIFQWQTSEHARSAQPEQPGDELEH